jgi:hypothetical protein
MKNWLDELVLQHSELESPKSFWMWSGLAAISAVIKDNVWLNRAGAYKLYPNIYVILHADSGLKKGPPISLAKDLVKSVNNTRVISGRSSIQGILKKLGTAYTVPGGKVINKSVGFVCASELSSALVEDMAALTILTDLYDRQYNEGEWESLLKMENFQLKDPTVSLLGGINDAHAEVFFGKKDIQGGFLARTFIVYEKEEQTINPLVRRMTHTPDRESLIRYLKEVAQLQGPLNEMVDDNNNPTPVGKYYEEWYYDFKKQVRQMGVKDETGTLNRFGDSVLKVAILLSLAEEPKLEISLSAMENAITIGERLIGNIRQTTMGKRGTSTSAQLKAMIIKELLERENHTVSRVVLMKKMWLHYSDSNEFDNLMQSFDAARLIKTESIGNQIVYKMPEGQARELQEFLAGKVRKNV